MEELGQQEIVIVENKCDGCSDKNSLYQAIEVWVRASTFSVIELIIEKPWSQQARSDPIDTDIEEKLDRAARFRALSANRDLREAIRRLGISAVAKLTDLSENEQEPRAY